MKQFCDHQTKCKEDKEETWTCQANMAEGRVFQCPYTSLKDAKERIPYHCSDVTTQHLRIETVMFWLYENQYMAGSGCNDYETAKDLIIRLDKI